MISKIFLFPIIYAPNCGSNCIVTLKTKFAINCHRDSISNNSYHMQKLEVNGCINMLETIVNKGYFEWKQPMIWKIEILRTAYATLWIERTKSSCEIKVSDGKTSALKLTSLFSERMLASNNQKKWDNHSRKNSFLL